MTGYTYRGEEPTVEPKKAIRVSPEVKALLDQAKQAVADRDAAIEALKKENEELQDAHDKQVRLLSDVNKRADEKQAELEAEQEINTSLTAALEEAKQKLTAEGLLEEQIQALKETITHREDRVIELEKMLDDILKQQPAEDAVIFTGSLQQVTVQGKPVPVGKDALASLAGARLQFTVVAP